MSNGPKQLVINARERALSSDIMRLQSFESAAYLQAMFFMFMAGIIPDLGIGGMTYPSGPVTGAPPHVVLGGLLPVPNAGTFDLTISPGLIAIYAPDAVSNPDESSFKYIEDPGISALGVLTVAPNVGPGIRIDVLECQPIESTLETDNRDIFDPSTGLFSPVTVDKVRAKRLTYRIRQGSAGNGFPGVAIGWVPLTVIAIPAASANLNACTLWDVRYIVQARQGGPGINVPLIHSMNKQILGMDTITAAPARKLRGYSEADGTFAIGGHLRIGNYTGGVVYADSLDLKDNVNLWEPGFAPAVNSIWSLYNVSRAFGLPRWAKYTIGPANRVPSNPEGFFVVSSKACDAYAGINTTIVLPASYGLGNAVQTGTVMLSGVGFDPGGGAVLGTVVSDGSMQYMGENSSADTGPAVPLVQTAPPTVSGASFTLIPGVNYPANAKSIIVRLRVVFTGAPALVTNHAKQVFIADSTNSEVKFNTIEGVESTKVDAGGNGLLLEEYEVPVFPGENCIISFGYAFNPVEVTGITSAVAKVRGWRFLVKPV